MIKNCISIVSWNINSIRLRLPLIAEFLKGQEVDILCLQECKCTNSDFPYDEIKALGFGYIYYNGQKSYNGVAILSKIPLKEVGSFNFCEKMEARHIACAFENTTIIHNFYIPAGGDEPDPKTNEKFRYKLQYLDEMKDIFSKKKVEKTILLGEFNIAPHANDVWSHKQLLNVVSHTKLETDSLLELMLSGGFKDVVRDFSPNAELFSWWSYRAKDWKKSNRGRRLDHFWASSDIMTNFLSCCIFKEARSWGKPSDHVPVLATYKL